jgi:hypothetical protein
MTILDSMVTGTCTGFGAAIGTYLAGVYAIRHLERAHKNGGILKTIKDRIRKEVEEWE